MTPDKVIKVLAKYSVTLEEEGFGVRRLPTGADPMKVPGHQKMAHLRWMCSEAASFVRQDRMDKAFRWLGFIQGALWASGFMSVELLKEDN